MSLLSPASLPTNAWTSSLQDGIRLLSSDPSEALKKFDDAVSLRGIEVQVFPSRTVVLSRLRDVELAVRTQLSPDETASPLNDDQLFDLLQKLPPAVKSAVLSLSESSFDVQVSQAQSVLDQARRASNYIDTLPTEIVLSIGRYFVGNDKNRSDFAAIPLTGVSQRWRTLFLEDPYFWGRLHVSRGDGRKKVERVAGKGPLKSIELYVPQEWELAVVLDSLKGKMSATRRLKIRALEEGTGSRKFWNLCAESSALEHLEISTTTEQPMVIPSPHPLRLCPQLVNLSLENLDLGGQSSLFLLVQHLPNLRNLNFVSCTIDFDDPTATTFSPSLLSLPHLQILSIDLGCTVQDPNSAIFLLPQLQELTYDANTSLLSNLLFPPHPHPPNTDNLRFLSRCTYTTDVTFTPFPHHKLSNLAALTSLTIGFGLLTNATIQALIWPEEGRGEGSCPLLDTLELSLEEYISVNGLLDVVTSRSEGFGRGRCRKLVGLTVWGPHGDGTMFFAGVNEALSLLLDTFEVERY